MRSRHMDPVSEEEEAAKTGALNATYAFDFKCHHADNSYRLYAGRDKLIILVLVKSKDPQCIQ